MKIFKKIKKSFVKKVVYYSISNSRLFDKKWYLSQYPEIGKVNPVKHYLKKGWLEGKNPSEKFSTSKYLYAYPDVQYRNMNLLSIIYFMERKEVGCVLMSVRLALRKLKKRMLDH